MSDILTGLCGGLTALLHGEVFLYLTMGVLIGMFFGLVPGLSGLSGMGILLPFAIGKPPEIAFAFLLGMFAATMQTEMLPAVLLGVPGTAQSQATVLEGYPMAKRGEAGRALSAAHLACIMGSVVALVIFTLFLPLLRLLLDQFGAPEYFMLTMLGLVMAGSLAGSSVLRGLMTGTLGLLISTVGFAPNTDFPRYAVFGWPYLWDGISIIPIVLGLFAVPEVIELMLGRSTISRVALSVSGGIYDGVRDTVREYWLVVRCSTIGTICGMIPGLGGPVAEWLGYGHAVNSARDRSLFGRGDVRGVIGTETATAAQKAGAILPTVAFGVPGNAGMAILMGAFMIGGLRPGPNMLAGQLNLTFLMVWTIVVANVIGGAIGLGIQRWLVLVCYLRASILAPLILSFMVVGASLATSDLGDILIFGVFGAIGYIFKRTDWPRVPMIIGVVLGSLIERYLFITVERYGHAWLWNRPLVVFGEFLICAAIALPLYSAYRRLDSPRPQHPGAPLKAMRAVRSATWWVGIGLAFLVICAVYVAASWPLAGRLFPWVIGFAFLTAAALHALSGLTRGVYCIVEPEGGHDRSVTVAARVQVLGWIAGFLLLVALFGELVAVPTFVFVFMMAEREPLWLASVAAAGIWAFIFGILVNAVHVNLPVPLFGSWLGV
jgi:putative tricarboxylic transport membrane protein